MKINGIRKFEPTRARCFKLIPWLILTLMILTSYGVSGNAQELDYPGTRSREDTDNDGLSDDIEVKFLTDQFDADSDDDGVLDGDEGLDTSKSKEHPDNDPDGDGWNNAMDADSDGDGILDGTEVGLTNADINWTATDQTKGRFYPDQDPTTTTDPTNKDTDGDSWSDGDEDRNANGKYEPTMGETNPNFKDYDDDGIQDDSDEDDDNDGMPDEFEKLFANACNPLDPEDADDDYDGDGFTNIREYRGNNDKPGDKDWSDPEDPMSKPNIAPIVEFKSGDFTIDEYGTKLPRITVEAKQKITFNDTLLEVTDEDEDEGLTFIWDWGDGSEPFIRYDVRPQKDPPTTHVYEVPTTYTIVLKVEDSINNVGEAKLVVDVIHPEGVTELVIEMPESKEKISETNTLQRSGWFAVIIEDIEVGDRITIDLRVHQDPEVGDTLGLRVFVIPEENFENYKRNDIGYKKISREYEEYWSGDVGTTISKKKIQIEAEKDDDIVVIFDNGYYEEGEKYIPFDEPVEYSTTITREKGTPAILEIIQDYIIPIIILVIVILALIILAFYTKTRRERMLEHKTRDRIYSYINRNPGIHYRKILSDLDLQMGTLTHHLNMLERQNYIKSSHDNMYKRFYPFNAKMDTSVRLTEIQERILRKIQTTPGISQTAIAAALNLDRKLVYYHIKRLADEGLLVVQPNGRESKCFYPSRPAYSGTAAR
ncbi:winged helix-turn-helix transcriptional regulator [[Eubacterium] cellulosolvens]